MSSRNSLRASLEQSIQEQMNQSMERLQNEISEAQAQLMQMGAHVRNCVEQTLSDFQNGLNRIVAQYIGDLERQWEQQEAALESRGAASERSWEETLSHLRAAWRRVDEKSSPAEMLSALLDEAAVYAPRVALFIARGNVYSGWQGRGFDEKLQFALSLKSLHIPVTAETILSQATRDQKTSLGTLDSPPSNPLLTESFGAPHNGQMVAVPLIVRSRTLGVIYADAGLSMDHRLDIAALEWLVHLATTSMELLSLRLKQPIVEGMPAESVMSEDVRKAARESLPPERTPSTFVESKKSPSLASSLQAEQSQPVLAAAQELEADAARKLHDDARRFARLLVSEIKLYNEQAVADGRKEKNLYSKLKRDIERSREMYEARISPFVASQVDYFYQEAVQLLAEGDPSLLGEGFPGSTVPSSRC